MSYGKIEYDEDGLPICEICGLSFKRVIAHARQKHGVSEREYKIEFGLDLKKGICSKESAEKSREIGLRMADSLTDHGEKTRFKKGHKRPRVISEQTRLKFIARLPDMAESMILNGRRMGLSGLGNQKRWSFKSSANNPKQ